MTLNCEVPLEEARDAFAKERTDETAADYLQALEEYWRCDLIGDKQYANALRAIADYLDNKASQK